MHVTFTVGKLVLKCAGKRKQNDKVTCNYVTMGIVHACNDYTIVPFLCICVQGLFTMPKASNLCHYHMCMYHTFT